MLQQRTATVFKSITKQYITRAVPVSSASIVGESGLDVSSATIRNEMVRLTDMKLLNQAHTSAGRSPTPKALKFYVEQIMKPKDISVADEVAVKERVWDYRQEVDKLLREATKTLAEKTKTLLFVHEAQELY